MGGVAVFNTDRLSEKQLLQMCTRAVMEVKSATGRDIKSLKNGRTGARRIYTLQSEEHSLYTFVQAFSCPTIPPIYLEVEDITEEGEKIYWVWVILETASIHSQFVDLEQDYRYRYQLKIAQSIAPCISKYREFVVVLSEYIG